MSENDLSGGGSQDDEQFVAFMDQVDELGPTRAAARLRQLLVPGVDALLERYEQQAIATLNVGPPRFLSAKGRSQWYAGPRQGDKCWWRLVELLERGGDFDADALKALSESTDKIVGLLDHPQTAEFRTQGLVLGHVQSGKTTNFTGVIAKAADRGYRFVIVLAGVHNELRRQTQNRLLHQLVEQNKDFWVPLTTPDADFYPPANAPAYFGKYTEQRVLCVVKKNAAVLRRLNAWLRDASEQLRRIPALVIDDEADQAGIATKSINPLVLELLERLPRAAYVGYTATPFANLLIDPASQNLYPKDFIVHLDKPGRHFGPESIFGRDPLDSEDAGDYDDGALDMVREVPSKEVGMVRPSTNADVDGFAPQIAGEIRRAILYFWLVTAARRVRGGGVPHSTMLIHTSARVPVHESFRGPIQALQRRVAFGVEQADEDTIQELEALWLQETQRVPATRSDGGTPSWANDPVLWSDVLGHLPEILRESKVVLDNSRSSERLDYSGEPVVAIAIGGNTLSRGLTLEGLVVSYFVRSVSAYDTLLQMGRWFGYRLGYEDLPRIWMTDELEGWFRHLAGVEAEIRRDIDRYTQDEVDPMTFAVRIRTHPSLAITSAAKMGAAVAASASYGGLRVQTRYFRADDDDWLTANLVAANTLVSSLGGSSTGTMRERLVGYVWTDVDVALVLEFLAGYSVHEKAPDNATHLLQKYVRARNDRGLLRRWNVALVGSGTANRGDYDFGSGISVPRVVRARLPHSPDAAADIKTLMSRRDAALDLEIPRGLALTEKVIENLRREQMPDTPLLALYPIDRVSTGKTDGARLPLAAVRDVMGMGVVFPRPDDGEDEVSYVQADLSNVMEEFDGYIEDADESLLEAEDSE